MHTLLDERIEHDPLRAEARRHLVETTQITQINTYHAGAGATGAVIANSAATAATKPISANTTAKEPDMTERTNGKTACDENKLAELETCRTYLVDETNSKVTCALCCEEIDDCAKIFCCQPVIEGPFAHTFCADCITKEVDRTSSGEVDFEALNLRRGALICPYVSGLRAWRCVMDLHDSGSLANLIHGQAEDTHDAVSSLFESFATFAFNIERDVAIDALAACGCPSLPFTDRVVASALPTDVAFDAYMAARHRVRDDVILAEAQAEVERCMRELRAAYEHRRAFNFRNALLSRQLKNQMPKARQCGRCGFGPVDHFACGDLLAHQGQRVGAARVDNSCPACGWFGAELRDWPEWDGELTPWHEESGDFAPARAPQAEEAPSGATEGEITTQADVAAAVPQQFVQLPAAVVPRALRAHEPAIIIAPWLPAPARAASMPAAGELGD